MEFYDDTLLFNVAWGGAARSGVELGEGEARPLPADWENASMSGAWTGTSARSGSIMDDSLMNTQDLSKTINAPRSGFGGAAPARRTRSTAPRTS